MDFDPFRVSTQNFYREGVGTYGGWSFSDLWVPLHVTWKSVCSCLSNVEIPPFRLTCCVTMRDSPKKTLMQKVPVKIASEVWVA